MDWPYALFYLSSIIDIDDVTFTLTDPTDRPPVRPQRTPKDGSLKKEEKKKRYQREQGTSIKISIGLVFIACLRPQRRA